MATALVERQLETKSTLRVTLEGDSEESIQLITNPMDEMFVRLGTLDSTVPENNLTDVGGKIIEALMRVPSIQDLMCANFAFTFQVSPGCNALAAIKEIAEILGRHIGPDLTINYRPAGKLATLPLLLDDPDVQTDVRKLAH